MGRWGPRLSSCGQLRLWSDWADAQADLSLCCVHRSFCWFCHAQDHLYILYLRTKTWISEKAASWPRFSIIKWIKFLLFIMLWYQSGRTDYRRGFDEKNFVMNLKMLESRSLCPTFWYAGFWPFLAGIRYAVSRAQPRERFGRNSLPKLADFSLFWAEGEVKRYRTDREIQNLHQNFSLKSRKCRKTSPCLKALGWPCVLQYEVRPQNRK